MTHDELLAKIEKINLVSCDQTVDLLEKVFICGECFVCQALYALHSVVELHKPYDFTWGETFTACECGEMYPCPTIQTIDKELA